MWTPAGTAANPATANRSSPALPVLVFCGVAKSLDEETGDALRLVVREEEAGAGDGDHSYPGAGLKRAPLLAGERAIALFGVHHPGRYPRVAQSRRRRAPAA